MARIIKNFHHLSKTTAFQLLYILFCVFTLAHWAACGFFFLASWEVCSWHFWPTVSAAQLLQSRLKCLGGQFTSFQAMKLNINLADSMLLVDHFAANRWHRHLFCAGIISAHCSNCLVPACDIPDKPCIS
jgi:hypothetical protein